MLLTEEKAGGSEPRDAELSERMASGDMGALGEAYREHRDRIYTLVLRLVGDQAAAADITHDAFLRAYDRASQFRGRASLGTWICRIATNLGLRYLRRERWRLLPLTRSAEPFALPRGPVLIEVLDLDRAIAALPEKLRVVFVLHAVEGHSHAEIAQLLRISEASCRQRLHRARVQLASDLEAEESR
jgi:RNA polymerase sigma-70 factor, ECF subfamily